MKTIKRFFRKLTNLIDWLPVIWNDYPYDYSSIYTILDKKLNKMLVFFESGNVWQSDESLKPTIKELKLVISLLDKIREDFYGLEYMEYLEEDMEFIPIENDDCYELEFKLKKDNLDEYFKKYHVKNIPTDFTERKKLAIQISRKKEEQCKRLFFKLLNDKIERWWD